MDVDFSSFYCVAFFSVMEMNIFFLFGAAHLRSLKWVRKKITQCATSFQETNVKVELYVG